MLLTLTNLRLVNLNRTHYEQLWVTYLPPISRNKYPKMLMDLFNLTDKEKEEYEKATAEFMEEP